jgi:hypothetical protein
LNTSDILRTENESMLKSRRDKFEDQLRALHTDLNDLSHKMSAPAAYSSNVHSSPGSTNHQLKKVNPKAGL